MRRFVGCSRRAAGWWCAALLASGRPAQGVEPQEARLAAEQLVSQIAADEVLLRGQVDSSTLVAVSPERRLALGQLALGARDFARAIDLFRQVDELHRQGRGSDNSHADALFLLGDAYFQSEQLLAARRQYLSLLGQSAQVAYTSYAGKSLARLVDIAVETGRRRDLDELLDKVQTLRVADPSGSFDYARGKLLFALERYDEAQRWLVSVERDSPYFPQAQYIVGVGLLRAALPGEPQVAAAEARKLGTLTPRRLEQAIAQFERVAQLPSGSEEHRHVVDLARLAVGRLYYESGALLQAVEHYIQVERDSPVYLEMLFELAWVYVRVEDYSRAERAMELLAATAPNSLHVAEGALLRADLMLRAGRFKEARAAYEAIRDRFAEPRETIEQVLLKTQQPAVYYDRLVEDAMAVSGATQLPEVVLEWVKAEARGDRVFSVIDDVTGARRLDLRGQRVAEKLQAVLAAPSRAQVFPQVDAALAKTYALLNRLSKAQVALARGLDGLNGVTWPGSLLEARAARQRMMDQVAELPATAAAFERRRAQGTTQWNEVSQAIQRLTLQADQLQAVINGLQRLLEEGSAHVLAGQLALRKKYRAEVEANTRDLEVYRRKIDKFRKEVELGRLQVGMEDAQFESEARLRAQFDQLIQREIQALGQRGAPASDYARAVNPTLQRIAQLRQKLEGTARLLHQQVEDGATELGVKVRAERELLDSYRQQLDAVDQLGRELLGSMAVKNFQQVSERLQGIVLRADVGIVQQAWEHREERRDHLKTLQRRRALKAQHIESEAVEVLDLEDSE